MSNFTFRIVSAGATAFFGGLFAGWIVLGQPFTTNDKAVAATALRFEAPKPGRVAALPDYDRLADPGTRPSEPAPESRPKEPGAKIAAPKSTNRPADTKPATPVAKDPPASQPERKVDGLPGGLPEVFPTRRLKKLANRGNVPGLLIGLLDDEDDDD